MDKVASANAISDEERRNLNKMSHLKTKMQVKVTIPALTCLIILTAAAVLLVCATNQTENGRQLDRISHVPETIDSTPNRTALRKLSHKSVPERQRKTLTTIRNGTTPTNRPHLGDISAQASIIRPLIMKHLLHGGRRKPAPAAFEESGEEEEVTKTIMIPMNLEDAHHKMAGKQSEAAESSLETNEPTIQYMSGRQMQLSGSNKQAISQKSADQQSMGVDTTGMQPKAEASLRLTSTEIGGLLNDRDAPEFYRERELNGDGVLVGEERPSPVSASHNSPFISSSSRASMAASGHFGNQFMGGHGGGFGSESLPYGNNPGYDTTDATLYRHRLNQAASEEAYGGEAGGGGGVGGFNHRFGHQSFGIGGEGELGYGPASGGLMQAPNEYNEVNSMAAYMGEGQSHPYGSADYSAQSGLLRAGSEGLYGTSGGLGQAMAGPGGGFMGHGGSLETAAAAGGYGPATGMGHSAGLMGHSNAFSGAARLQAHASYNPYMQSAGEADYTSRFGQHQAGGFAPIADYSDQRDFVGHHHHQHQHSSNSHDHNHNHQLMRSATSGNPHSSGMAHSRGLLPLTPTVPLPEDLPSPVTQPSVLSSNQREQISQQPADIANLVRHQQSLEQQQRFSARTRSSHQQTHEALEEDPTDTSSDDEPAGPQQHSDESFTSTSEPEESTSARPAEHQMGRPSGELGASLVLNVPPPADHSASTPLSQMVEFSRVGSAGYLGPRGSPLTKKAGHRLSQVQAAGSEEDNDGGSEAAFTANAHATGPNENPAHAGKYIID